MNRVHWRVSLVLLALEAFSGCKTSVDAVPEPTRVVVQRASVATEEQDLAYSGTIEESETIPLSFSSVGTVSQVYVSEGAAVKKGQLLARLDNTTYRNAYEMAHATELQAEDAHKRATPMHEKGNLPDVKYVEVETALQQAKAAAAIAKKNLDDCNLYATTNGFVGKRSIDPGMAAIPNLTSITLVKIAKVYARVSIPENEIFLVKKANKAMIKIGALGSQEYSGTVEEIGVVADLLAHTYRIKIGIANRNYDIKPGMICNVTLETTGAPHGLFVPSRAVLVDEQGRTFVYVVDQNKATRKYVKTGNLLKNGVEITGGLNERETIVVTGQHKLADNSFVCIVGQ